MVYSWTIHGYEFQESDILNHELLMNSSWIVHGSANRFKPWIVHGLLMNNSWLWISGKQGSQASLGMGPDKHGILLVPMNDSVGFS